MDDFPGSVQERRLRAVPVLVAVLHPPGAAGLAEHLTASWRGAMPRASFAAFPVGEALDPVGRDALALALRAHQPSPPRLVLAAIGVAQYPVMQMALAGRSPICRGLLGCGEAVAQAMVPIGPACRGIKLRLAWAGRDRSPCMALSDWLGVARAAGVDAQGGALGCGATPLADDPAACGLSPVILRMSQAYLAELVAVALGAPLDDNVAHA